MSNNKQSSLDFIYHELFVVKRWMDLTPGDIEYIFNKAKAMHKDEIKMTAIKCHFEGTRQISKTSEEYIQYGEQYYNETFGGNND